jgi:flagellar hook-associated protein 3 FlgL
MRKVLDLQNEIKDLSQYQKNAATLKDSLDASYAAMQGLKQISDRATEIATRSDDLATPEELKTYGTEVDQLIERTLQLANSRNQSNYLFGGTETSQPPYVATRDPATGQITGVTYQGTNNVPQSEIAEGITIAVTVPGQDTSGQGGPRGLIADSRYGADLFNHLIALRDNLNSGNAATVRDTDLPALLKDEDNVLFHFGNVGALQTRLDTASTFANSRSISLDGLVSKEADADLSQTLVALSEVQNAYQAALKTGGTILNQSLLDYIH